MSREIVLPSEPSAAIDLFARFLARSIGAELNTSDGGASDRFLLANDGVTFTLTLALRDLSVRVEKRGAAMESIPYWLGESVQPCPPRLRVLFAGGTSTDRRLRMTSRVIAEARGRGVSGELIVAGSVPSDWTRAVMPEQQAEDLTPQEVMRLVRASRCVLECGDELETPTELALIATAAGVPVIVHRTSPIAARRPECVVAVDEWSADAFVDAIAGPLRDVTSPPADPAGALLRILERASA